MPGSELDNMNKGPAKGLLLQAYRTSLSFNYKKQEDAAEWAKCGLLLLRNKALTVAIVRASFAGRVGYLRWALKVPFLTEHRNVV